MTKFKILVNLSFKVWITEAFTVMQLLLLAVEVSCSLIQLLLNSSTHSNVFSIELKQ